MERCKYTINLRPGPEGGYTVLVPALPEVVTYGETEEEALRMAHEAIELALEVRRDEGDDIPADIVPLVPYCNRPSGCLIVPKAGRPQRTPDCQSLAARWLSGERQPSCPAETRHSELQGHRAGAWSERHPTRNGRIDSQAGGPDH